MSVFVRDADLTILNCDVMEGLASLPDESVHCVVTSPPYWGLRDYGTGLWDGGNPDCDHVKQQARAPHERKSSTLGGGTDTIRVQEEANVYRDVCGKCGAHRADQQLGLEPTPEAYVTRMVAVFREVRRVLRRDGTCFLNMGDSYISGQGGRQSAAGELPSTSRFDRPDPKPRPELPNPPAGWAERAVTRRTYPGADSGLKPKDLAGVPWMLAFALRADGWYLRADIIWSKPNPMPESVTDRPTKSHEYLFLLTRAPRYFFDQEAVREPLLASSLERGYSYRDPGGYRGAKDKAREPLVKPEFGHGYIPVGRNVRSVWEIPTQPYPQAHFATFPEELARRCVLAGSSERGCCPVCGAPWVRETEKGEPILNAWSANGAGQYDADIGGMRRTSLEEGSTLKHVVPRETIGWRPSCDCAGPNCLKYQPVPCTVLDPFFGSGTVGLVARQHGRHTIGLELKAEYCALAAGRLQQLSLLSGAGS